MAVLIGRSGDQTLVYSRRQHKRSLKGVVFRYTAQQCVDDAIVNGFARLLGSWAATVAAEALVHYGGGVR